MLLNLERHPDLRSLFRAAVITWTANQARVDVCRHVAFSTRILL